jgi:hypothetical protein
MITSESLVIVLAVLVVGILIGFGLRSLWC